MKTKNDPRHKQRIRVVKELFAYSFHDQPLTEKRAYEIVDKQKKIDELIEKGAPQWPIAKISKIDVAILRNAVYELSYDTDTPSKVIIDEAVELAKEFGTETSPKFVNGVLGTILTWTKR